MDREEFNNFHAHGSTFVGAIFMSNHATKQECLQRKLFGLPSSKAWFMKKIKAGMLLFLFEHEERKLYGVFEATSDGAINIMPNAFIASGNTFPAQILFKRVWMCKPLSEDEFRDAIKENYFAPNKFNFGLSYEQVFKLIRLFSLKRINVKQHHRPGIPNAIIKEFERCEGNNVRVIGHGRSKKFDSDEYSTDDVMVSKRYPGLSGSNTNSSMSCVNLDKTNKPSFTIVGRGSNQFATHAAEPRPPYLMRYESKPPFLMGSTSPKGFSIEGNFSAHRFPGSGDKIPHLTPGMSCPFLPREPIALIGSSMDIQVPQFRSQLHPSQVGPNPNIPVFNYIGSSFPIHNPSDISLPSLSSDSYPSFQDYTHTSQTEHYDPSNPRISFSPGMTMAKGTNSLPSMQSPSNAHGHPEASRQEFDSRRQHCGGIGPSSDYIPLQGTDGFDRNVESSNLSSPRKGLFSSYSSEYDENDNSEKLRPYPATNAEEYYPAPAMSRLRSDDEQSRTSVFSRLSKTSKASHLSKTPEARCFSKMQETGQLYDDAHKPVTSLSLDQLVGILSQRREKLVEMTKVPKQSIIRDNDERFESTAKMEPRDETSLRELESSNNVMAEDVIDEDADADESSELLFLNFKRRSGIRKLAGENEMNVSTPSAADEGTPQKRRKLERPSLGEEECQNMQCSSPEIGVKSVVENSKKNIDNGELSVGNHLDTGNENSSVSETSLGNIASDKTEKNTEGSRSRMKEVSNRNLRWFLLKSIDIHAKASNGDHESEKARNAAHMINEVSVLPGHSKHGGQGTDGINEVVSSFVHKTKVLTQVNFLPLLGLD